MAYQDALNKAWQRLSGIKKQGIYSVKFLSDEYSVDIASQSALSLSCNVPAHNYITILLLHYLIRKTEGLPKLTENWISFPEIDGGKGYYPTFQKRVLQPIVRKYGKSPYGLLTSIGRFPAKRVLMGDIGIVLEALPQIPVLITFWKADEEFSAQANLLFDESIKEILPTEDIVVLAEFIAKNI